MKKRTLLALLTTQAVLVWSLVAMAVIPHYAWYGSGAEVTATTTPQVVSVPNTNRCYAVSCYNSGSVTAYFSVGDTTNNWVATNAIPVPAGLSYSFISSAEQNENKNRPITGVVYGTASSSAGLSFAFQ